MMVTGKNDAESNLGNDLSLQGMAERKKGKITENL